MNSGRWPKNLSMAPSLYVVDLVSKRESSPIFIDVDRLFAL